MKLGNSSAPVEVHGGGTHSSFSIAMNGKAFRVLSDTLYQNKIGSIVREISCNAYDAHVMAGTPEKPFTIHLPDAFEPWFSVKDYGIGLSPDEIVNVFTVYFQSTKDQSNDTVGAFGLGAKTPFSYTDQFTVTSIKNGERRIYSAFITESGVPSITEMDCAKTDEHNGVEIKLSVRREDFHNFAKETSRQLKFFKVLPEVVNSSNFAFEQVPSSSVFSNADVNISSDSVPYGTAWAHIIQGNVGYPLDVSQVRDKLSPNARNLLDNLNGFNVQFHFGIGEIGVTASREGVEYNKLTIDSIEKLFGRVSAALEVYVKESIKEAKTLYDKVVFLNRRGINKFARASGIKLDNVNRDTSGTYYFDFTDLVSGPEDKNNFNRRPQLAKVSSWNESWKQTRTTVNPSIVPSDTQEFIIFIRDTGLKPNIRVKSFMDGHTVQGKNVRYLEVESVSDKLELDDTFIATLSKTLGGFTGIKKVSELPIPVVEKDENGKPRTAYTRPTYWSMTKFSYYDAVNARTWDREYDKLSEMTDEFTYVVVDNCEFINSKVNCKVGEYASYVQAYTGLRAIKTNTIPLIAIRSKEIGKIKDKPNFIPLVDYIEKERKNLDVKKLIIQWKHETIRNMVAQKMHIDDEIQKAIIKEVPKNIISKLAKFSSNTRKNKSPDHEKLEAIRKFVGGFDATKLRNKYEKRIDACYKSIEKRWPLVACYDTYYVRSRIPMDHLIKYIVTM